MSQAGVELALREARAPRGTQEKLPRWSRWTPEQARAFGSVPMVAPHTLHDSPMFSDAAILQLIERYPRDRMQAFTMGSDPGNRDEWKPVAFGTASAEEIWRAIERGRLWCKLLNVQAFDSRYRRLLDELYGELTQQCPGFLPVRKYGTLLIASPRAQVYYHADPQPNVLWHIRGEKRIWVYPSGDRELIDLELMEDIFASFVDEEAPYDSRFDAKAEVFDLRPGDVVSWPQNSPHRIVNQRGVNVSLSTVHETRDSDRRKLVYCANRLLRREYRLPFRSTAETGVLPYCKQTVYRAFRRFGLVETPKRRVYLTALRLDASAEEGMASIAEGPVLTEFSQKDFRLERDAAGKLNVVEA